MNRSLLAAGFALAAGSALAADLPSRKAPLVYAPPLFTWAGFYAGVNAGYTFSGSDKVTTSGQALANINNVNGGARPASVSLNQGGFIGGAQIGYNFQNGPLVFGVETDLAFTSLRDSKTFVTANLPGAAVGPNTPLANTFGHKLTYLGTVRGRFGYAFDRTLVYATGGFAYGQVENTVNLFGPSVAPVNGALQFTGGRKKTEFGYVLGAGVEHAFTDKLSLKAEYLYYNLANSTVSSNVIAGSGGGGTGYSSRFKNDGHIVRAGLNYKFAGF